MAATAVTQIPLADGRVMKVGDVLKASWGYDQTNIDFYEIVGFTASAKSVKIVEVQKQFIDVGLGQDKVAPKLGVAVKADAKPMTKKLHFHNWGGKVNVGVNIASYAAAYLMENPEAGAWQTAAGWGH